MSRIQSGKCKADIDRGGIIIGANKSFCQLTGYTEERLISDNISFFSLVPEEELNAYMEDFELYKKEGGGTFQHRLKKADGSLIDVMCTADDFIGEDGHICSEFTIIDVSETKQKERTLQKQKLCLEMMTENSDEIFFDYDADNDVFTIDSCENGVESTRNYRRYLQDHIYEKFVLPSDLAEFIKNVNKALNAPTKGEFAARIDIIGSGLRNYKIAYESVADSSGKVRNIYGILYTDSIKVEKADYYHTKSEIQRLSRTDPITGLLNKNCFVEDCAKVLKDIFNTNESFAIGYSDINDFSYINENFGYEAGDRMLKDFGNVIKTYCVVGCRIYSDFFVSLYKASDRETLIEEIGKRNSDFTAMQKNKYPMSDIQITCGLYFIRSADEDINTAIDNANLAHRNIKGSSDVPSGVYTERMRTKRSHDQTIASEIWNAIKSGNIELFLQPKFDLQTREIIGAEALTRWKNPDGSYKLPYEFINVLENVGYITQVDFYIYEQVLKNLAKWKSEGKKLVPVSVNFSRKHNNYPDFVDRVIGLADFYRVDKGLIEIEVTESCFTQDVKNLFHNMRKLRENGFKIDIDDFGTGYSSLSVLIDAPVDIVKVDKVFLDNIDSDARSREYINQICNLIRSTRKEIIFEGVETEQQAKILADSGHKMAQGWLFDKAIPVADFEDKYL